LSSASAAALKAAELKFVIRYLSLGATESPGDLDLAETQAILNAGLALMAVQHVRYPGWLPSMAQGTADGGVAATHAVGAGLGAGTTVWLDLEGVSSAAPAETVIAYCNAWNQSVRAAGYDTGIYVGAACGLDGTALFEKLNLSRYWKSQSDVPNVERRGYCMTQLLPSETVAGVSIDFDVIGADYLGGLPRWVCAT
jgi:hypothetical protein